MTVERHPRSDRKRSKDIAVAIERHRKRSKDIQNQEMPADVFRSVRGCLSMPLDAFRCLSLLMIGNPKRASDVFRCLRCWLEGGATVSAAGATIRLIRPLHTRCPLCTRQRPLQTGSAGSSADPGAFTPSIPAYPTSLPAADLFSKAMSAKLRHGSCWD